MSPLLHKEIRLLLPSWVAALVAATMPVWVGKDFEGMLPFFFGAGILAVALSTFGQETSCGTFAFLIVQPVERRRLWRIKWSLLALALASVWTWFVLCIYESPVWKEHDDLALWLVSSALLTLLAFSGGLWCTLLLRDVVTAFICACVAPTIICAVMLLTVGHWVDPQSAAFSNILYSVLAVYGVAGFFWARRLFLGAQDVPWTGGQIHLRAGRRFSLRWFAFEFKGRQNKWAALVRKELQMQEVTMFVIPLLALLHLAVLGLLHFAPHWIEREQTKKMVLEAIPVIWLGVMPVLIGCVAVAEERRLNTLEGLLCQPVSQRASFAVKLFVVLGLGVLLGGVMPWVLSGGVRPWVLIGLGGEHPEFEFQNCIEIAALITGISFYASTMSRGMLQAIPTAMCLPILGVLAFALSQKVTSENFPFGVSPPPSTLTRCVMAVTFIWLAFKNYKSLRTGWGIWIGNLIRAGTVFGCLILTEVVLFDRPWEMFMQLEKPHGAPRIIGAQKAAIQAWDSGLGVLLPDGRIWIGKIDPSWNSVSGAFVHGTNWVAMAASYQRVVAIQSDGTLWRNPGGSVMVQAGSDWDWKKIVSNGSGFLAIKQDGTLWGWVLIVRGKVPRPSEINWSVPERVGEESDWADVFAQADGEAIGFKRDGSVWDLDHLRSAPDGSLAEPAPSAGSSARTRARGILKGTNWSSIVSLNALTMAIDREGKLWAAGRVPFNLFGEPADPGWHWQMVRAGGKSDWVSLSSDGIQCDAVEADGTLSTMRFSEHRHPSRYADWLAAMEYQWFTFALARDGTLSCWGQLGVYTTHNMPQTSIMGFDLGPSRRPIFSTNILEAQK